jgi:SAM-dependent methyltransferase
MRWSWPVGMSCLVCPQRLTSLMSLMWLMWLTAMGLGCGATDTVPNGGEAEPASGPMSQPPDDFYPDPVIDAMLALTRPQPNERLIDLGCGDGRIVLEALRRVPGLTGVGVDIDPARIREANTNAALRGLTGRVRFLEQNIFDTEIRADVVTLYLLPEVNLALRPTLFSSLAPGARVVSHDFDMEDWHPDAIALIPGKRVYLWVMPAPLGGRWVVERADVDTVHMQPGSAAERLGPGTELELMQGFQTFVGSDPAGDFYLRGRIDGLEVDAFVAPRTGPAARLRAVLVDTPEGQYLEGLLDLSPFVARRLTVDTVHQREVDPDLMPREL